MANNPDSKYKKGQEIIATIIVNGKSIKCGGKIIGSIYAFDESDGKTQWRYQAKGDIPFEIVPEDTIIKVDGKPVEEVEDL